MKYDAFISYSHAADGALAPALQRGLHRLAKPWYALRALRVYRDETNLAADPGMWTAIEAALSESRFLLLMASPEAARSKWVAKELDWWLAHREVASLLIVLSAGELVWNDPGRDFDWPHTDALPPSMAGRFTDEPKHVDLRWAHGVARLELDLPAFRAAVLDLAAPIHGKDKDLLDGEDVRQLARTRLFARSAVAGLAALTLASSLAAWLAIQQRRVAVTERAVAVEQANIALARQLAAQSGLLLRQEPDQLPLATLLALESIERYPSFEGNQALRAALTLLPQREWSSSHASAPTRGRVRALAFSVDGSLLAGAREDGTAELLDVRSHRTIATLAHDADPGAVVEQPGGGISWKAPGVDAEVVAVAFSADGHRLATGSNDRTARLWDTATGRQAARLAHDDAVVSVAFHPRRPWLATGSKDGSARIWNLSGGTLLRRVRASAEVRQVVFSPNGRHLAAIDTDGCVQLLDVEAAAAAERHWCWGSAGLGLAFSSDGSKLATASGDRAGVFEVGSGRRMFEATHASRLDSGQPESFSWVDQVAFSPSGEWLASAGRDGTARVWDLGTGQETVRLQHHSGVQALAFSPDGAALLTASTDGTARLWDLRSGRERLRAVHPGGSEGVAFSPQGRLAASGGSAGSIDVWRLTSGDQPLSIDHRATVGGGHPAIDVVGFAPDGRRLAGIDKDGGLRLWSIDGELQGQLERLYGADKLVFSDDGRYLAVRARNPAVSLFDLRGPPTRVELLGARDASDVAISPRFIAARDRRLRRLLVWQSSGGAAVPVDDDADPWKLVIDARSEHLATLHQNDRGVGTLRVRSLPALRETGRIPFEREPQSALSPEGVLLALTGNERANERSPWRPYVELYDVATARRTLRVAGSRATWLNFSPDGRHLFSLGDPSEDQARELRVWRVADGYLEASLRHEADIRQVRVSARGDVLATRSGARIHVWSIPSGTLLSQIETAAGFGDLAFTPDGERLLTGTRDGTLVLWLWRSEDLRDEACRRLTRNPTADEWQQYLGDRPYRATCPALSTHADVPASR